MSRVVLPTRRVYEAFRTKASQMTCIDYDLEELEGQLFHALSLPATQCSVNLASWYDLHRHHGTWSKETHDDGLILVSAMHVLEEGVRQVLADVKLYEPEHGLQYKFECRLGSDVVLQKI